MTKAQRKRAENDPAQPALTIARDHSGLMIFGTTTNGAFLSNFIGGGLNFTITNLVMTNQSLSLTNWLPREPRDFVLPAGD